MPTRRPSKTPPRTSSPSLSDVAARVTCPVIPLGNRLVIEPPPEVRAGETIRGGIVIPESSAVAQVPNAYYVAKVLAAGPDCKRVKAGDTIVADRPRMFEVKVPGESAADKDLIKVKMMREDDVHCIVKP